MCIGESKRRAICTSDTADEAVTDLLKPQEASLLFSHPTSRSLAKTFLVPLDRLFLPKRMESPSLDESLDRNASMLAAEPSAPAQLLQSTPCEDKKRDAATAIIGKEPRSGETCKRANNNNNKKQKIPTIPSRLLDSESLQLRRAIQQCCAADDLPTAMSIFDKAVANAASTTTKCLLEPQTFYNLLNLCGGLSDRGIHVGTPYKKQGKQTAQGINTEGTPSDDNTPAPRTSSTQEVDMESRQKHAERIMLHMTNHQIPLTESCYTAMVKLFSKTSRFDRAEALLNDAERTQQCRPRLRLYSPLLLRYCEEGRAVPALRVWLRLTQQQGLALTEREYAGLLHCACITQNAILMERVLSELAEEILVPCCETRQAIAQWFQSTAATEASSSVLDSDVPVLLSQIPTPYPYPVEPMGPVVANGPWTVSDGSLIDPQGVLLSGCLKGERLRPVPVSTQICDEVRQMNEAIVTSGRVEGDQSEYQGGRKGRKKDLDDAARLERTKHWNQLHAYLNNRGTIDVVVDGANVGYFETNFAGAAKHVDYDQIDWIVQHFLEQNQSVLVFLHARHVSPPLMPKSAASVVASWKVHDLLYVTPPNMNDDWFWLHAALTKDALVVSNDELRDHHFQMLAPRGFARWKDRHRVRFRFGPWEGMDGLGEVRRRAVHLTFPDPYSRRIQRVANGLVVPLPLRGDEHRFLDGRHNADDNATPHEETYLCLRPFRPSTSE